jgi:hypothetical protein
MKLANGNTRTGNGTGVDSSFKGSFKGIDDTFPLRHNSAMRWEVEFTEVFGAWWDSLDEEEQESVDASVQLLIELGPALPYPHSSDVKGARHGNMRELRVQHKGEPYRVLYAFDPRRTALLLIGGKKTGDDRWYTKNVPKADKIYDEHLKELEKRRRKS